MSLIDKIKKLNNKPLAPEKCEQCIFKIEPWNELPCLTCKYGKYGGVEKNFVKDESENT